MYSIIGYNTLSSLKRLFDKQVISQSKGKFSLSNLSLCEQQWKQMLIRSVFDQTNHLAVKSQFLAWFLFAHEKIGKPFFNYKYTLQVNSLFFIDK